eukprot:8967010-Karenia_brevis.AAC.1
MMVMLGADCNAQVGAKLETDSKHTIGNFGHGTCNVRGQWLKGWTTSHNLVITNTFFKKQQNKTTTYTGPHN